MVKISRLTNTTLTFRLTLRVMLALAILLMAALLTMFYFSRKAVKEEAVQNAAQALEATVERIDNILLSVEQASGNIYWRMLPHINQKDRLEDYARRLKEGNSYVADCHIDWNTDSLERMGWIESKAKGDATATFALPLYNGRQKVGTMAVDVSLAMLSKIVLEVKTSPNSFCTLIRNDGSILIHPDSSSLNRNILTLSKRDDHTMRETAKAMLNGDEGYRKVKLDGRDYYVFYKPFKRADVRGRDMTDLGWSVGLVLPEDDIFGDYIQLHYMVLGIAVAGLLLLLLSCYFFIHRQFLPLRQLERSAKRIADGYYDEPIPDSLQQDEVGRLQRHFQKMQQSLSTRMGELQRLSATLKERGEELQATYEHAQAADRMKTNFLYNMSDQMMAPVGGIVKSVETICDHSGETAEEDTGELVDEIQRQGSKVTALLNELIKDSEKIMN